MDLKILRRRLKIQGFEGLSDSDLRKWGGWIEFSPILCATFAALGTALAWIPGLLGLACIAALGAVLPFHPFDLIYNHGIRRFTKTRPLPSNGMPRRFACGMATVWLCVTAYCFYEGWNVAGYVLGSSLVATAVLVSTTHICIPSMIFQTCFRRSK